MFLNPLNDGQEHVAFAGTMRSNMIKMLDTVGLPTCLNIASTADLFGPRASHLFCSMSLLRFPVFVGELQTNFSGTVATINNDAFLRRMVDEFFVPILADVHRPLLVVPMGKTVEHFCTHAAAHAEHAQVLSGFPHPSGGNGHRVRIFNENKHSLVTQIAAFHKRRQNAAPTAGGLR